MDELLGSKSCLQVCGPGFDIFDDRGELFPSVFQLVPPLFVSHYINNSDNQVLVQIFILGMVTWSVHLNLANQYLNQ